jgi:hypothetical protein
VAAQRWTTPGDFAELFRQFRSDQADPAVLLITGTISQQGTAKLGEMYLSAKGTTSTPKPGDGLIRVLDVKGNALTQLSFPFDFRAFIDPPITLAEAPFAFSLPDVPNGVTIQVLRSGSVLASVNIASKLLVDAIRSIPNSGFDQNPDQRRNALLNKIGAFDAQLSSKNLTGAVNKLTNDIKKALQDWLVDAYLVQSPLQYTKTQLISLVDELIQRLGN